MGFPPSPGRGWGWAFYIDLFVMRTITLIIIHCSAVRPGQRSSADDIDRWHRARGWKGIGYHFVIRKDGTIEQGRPIWSQGAHAQGENYHTVGIHVCGNFEIAFPTNAQIESLSYLVGWVAEKYDIECTNEGVVGHRDLMSTACPGQNLYDMLQDIRGKAIWYQQNYQGGD